MSDASSHAPHDDHDGPIKTPKQLIIAVLFSFLVPIFGIVALVSYVTESHRPAAGSDGLKFKSTSDNQISVPASCLIGEGVRLAHQYVGR